VPRHANRVTIFTTGWAARLTLGVQPKTFSIRAIWLNARETQLIVRLSGSAVMHPFWQSYTP